MPSIKASKQGKAIILQARKERGWVRDSPKWLEEASQLIDSNWKGDGPYAYGISYGTWASFLAGKAINANAFKAYCQVLGVDWEEIVDRSSIVSSTVIHPIDWGEAPDVSVFYGRDRELLTLERWIVDEQCRLIALLGMGGIGKTSLSLKLAKQIQERFDYVIWRSLRNTPPLKSILASIVRFLSNGQETETDISHFIDYLGQYRCLILLDNADSVLRSGDGTLRDRAGYYLDGYDDYGEFIQQIGLVPHQSCVLMTSREKHRELVALEGATRPVRSLQLSGLTEVDGRELFAEIGTFTGSDDEWATLLQHYAGNPLALKITASAIHEVLNGDISRFIRDHLQRGQVFFDDINDLIARQFDRLSNSEKEVMYWLAIAREPVALADLQADLLSQALQQELIASLVSLRRRCLIERSADLFTQQPVIMEYVISRFIEVIKQEILDRKIDRFNHHALIKAQGKDHIRDIQTRLILQPLVDQLLTALGSKGAVESQLKTIIARLHQQFPSQPGYGGGNSLNLLCQLGVDLDGYDFSNLAIWQADLRGKRLHRVDFSDADLSHSIFTQTFSSVLSIAASSNGEWLATGDADGRIHLWQVTDFKQLQTMSGHTNWVRTLAFSPDGHLLASGSSDHTVKLWEVSTGRCLRTLKGHTSRVWAIAFSPDGHLLASGSNDQTVRSWNVRTGELIRVVQAQTGIRSIAFQPGNSQVLAMGHEDGTVQWWDLSTDRALNHLSAHAASVLCLAFHPNGEVLVTGSSDQTVKVWRLSDHQCLNVLTEHTKAVQTIAFSADGQRFVSGSGDHTLRLWTLDSTESLKVLLGHAGRIHAATFIHHGTAIASGSSDQSVKLWDAECGHCFRTLQGYSNWSLSMAFSADERMLASGSNDTNVRLWLVETGQLIKTLTGHSNQVQTVAFSHNQQWLASGSEEGIIKFWDINAGTCLFTLSEHDDSVWLLDFSGDDRLLVSASGDGTARVWNSQTGECLHVLPHQNAQVWSVAVSPDGQILASGSDDGIVRLWNSTTGDCLQELRLHTSQVWRVIFSPDGTTLISCGNDLTVKLTDINTRECIKTIDGFTDEVLSVAFTHDRQILVSDSSLSHPTVKVWNLNTGECVSVFEGHEDGVWSATLSRSGRLLATTSRDETMRLWDRATGDCLKVLRVEKLYEQMNIAGVRGLTDAQRDTLKALGAVERRA